MGVYKKKKIVFDHYNDFFKFAGFGDIVDRFIPYKNDEQQAGDKNVNVLLEQSDHVDLNL